MEEIWKDINGFEGYYSINHSLDVKSIKTGIILKPILKNNGYYFFNLCIEGCRFPKDLHRIVAENFIDNPKNKKEVNHKNGIKTDNRIDNLEWCTRSENAKHAYDTGLMSPPKTLNGENNPVSKLNDNKVREIREMYSTGDYKKSELGLIFNTDPSNIKSIVNNKTWKHIK